MRVVMHLVHEELLARNQTSIPSKHGGHHRKPYFSRCQRSCTATQDPEDKSTSAAHCSTLHAWDQHRKLYFSRVRPTSNRQDGLGTCQNVFNRRTVQILAMGNGGEGRN